MPAFVIRHAVAPGGEFKCGETQSITIRERSYTDPNSSSHYRETYSHKAAAKKRDVTCFRCKEGKR